MPKGIYKRKQFTEEHKKKMSDSAKGREWTLESRKKASDSKMGIHREDMMGDKNSAKRPEVREKIRLKSIGENNPFYGKKHASESRNKMSINSPRFWLGKHLTEETRRKIRGKSIGRKASEETRRKQSLAKKGKPHSEEWVKKLSGENASNWRDGISFEPYGLEFNRTLKEYIRKKYNYRCQECFRHQDELISKKGKRYKLNIHHIDYNKKNNEESNLIPLCKECHGKTQFDREKWTEYYKNKVIMPENFTA